MFEELIMSVQNWIDSLDASTKNKILYVIAACVALGFVVGIMKFLFELCLQVWRSVKKVSRKSRSAYAMLKSFNESGVFNRRDFFVLPEGITELLSLKKSRFLKIGRLLLVPDNLKERWYDGALFLDSAYINNNKVSDGKNIDQEIQLDLLEVLIIPRKVTKIIFQFTNLGDLDKTIQLFKPESPVKAGAEDVEEGIYETEEKKINRGLKNNIRLLIKDDLCGTERIIQEQQVFEYFIQSKSSKQFEVVFESIKKSEVKYPCKIRLKTDLRYVKTGNVNGKKFSVETLIEVPKDSVTPIHDILKKQVSLPHLLKFLSLGGFMLYGIPVCLFIVVLGFLFNLPIISFVLTILILILCVNLNGKLAQMFWDINH